ncbi:MAG: thiol:disulfide interchange protein DsbA/DsbL [Rhodocyclales bacterium]|nr:thiol:disulfide interchange protein DsbA/DsbL [Rhodocyclales bacterium]
MTYFVAALLLAAAGFAGAAELKEGQDYATYNPPRATESRDKIEVAEFFWYGCSHCFHMEPELQKWLKKLPKDASFRRVPAVFPGRDGSPGQWASGAALYYTLEAMGVGEKLHGDIFNAIHVDRNTDILSSDKAMADWLGKKGVDTKAFAATYQSFAVRSKVLRAMQVTQAHGLDGVPALIVDGRYRAINGTGDVFAVTDGLIDKARKTRAKK